MSSILVYNNIVFLIWTAYHCIEVAVDHEGRPATEVDVVLPPIRHVVCGPVRLQHQVALQFFADAILKLSSQLLHSGIFLLVQ